MEHEKQQVIITIGREYGSGGHLIADMLGEKYGCRCTTVLSSRLLPRKRT